MRGAGGGRRRRGNGVVRPGRRAARAVRRRLDRRTRARDDRRRRDPPRAIQDPIRPTMIRPILRYGERGLHERAAPVAAFEDDLHRLVDDMIETIYAATGIGVAATQIAVARRILVVALSVGRNTGELIVMV